MPQRGEVVQPAKYAEEGVEVIQPMVDKSGASMRQVAAQLSDWASIELLRDQGSVGWYEDMRAGLHVGMVPGHRDNPRFHRRPPCSQL